MFGNKEGVVIDPALDPWWVVLFHRILAQLKELAANDNEQDQAPPAADE